MDIHRVWENGEPFYGHVLLFYFFKPFFLFWMDCFEDCSWCALCFSAFFLLSFTLRCFSVCVSMCLDIDAPFISHCLSRLRFSFKWWYTATPHPLFFSWYSLWTPVCEFPEHAACPRRIFWTCWFFFAVSWLSNFGFALSPKRWKCTVIMASKCDFLFVCLPWAIF